MPLRSRGAQVPVMQEDRQTPGVVLLAPDRHTVTERVIKTLKYEWLRCVPLIKGYDQLALLRSEFESWYNAWRPHMTLEGLRPDDFYYDRKPEKLERDAKAVPGNIERHVFAETRLTAYRLKSAA